MGRLLSAARSVYVFDRSQWVASAALRNLPGIAISLLGGVAVGHSTGGVFAASGAMSVGFGATHRIGKHRWAPMLLAAVGMSISTLAGSLAGRQTWILFLAVGLWGFVGGIASTLGKAFLYVGLQCIIALLVTSSYTVPVHDASIRAAVTFLGGMIQFGLIVLIRYVEHVTSKTADPPLTTQRDISLRLLYQNLSYRTDGFQHGLRLAVALIYGTILGRKLGLGNSYWLPMTVAIVLKPSFDDTLSRGVARLAGTLVGAGLATLLTVLLKPTPTMLAILSIVFATLSFMLLNVNYAAFAVCITSYVVFLLSLVGIPEARIVHYRVLNTALGGGLAMLMHARVTHVRRSGVRLIPSSGTPGEG